jgi:hypothetical protein
MYGLTGGGVGRHALSREETERRGRRGGECCQLHEGAAARPIHQLYRSLREHWFADMKTKDCLSIRSEDFA